MTEHGIYVIMTIWKDTDMALYNELNQIGPSYWCLTVMDTKWISNFQQI